MADNARENRAFDPEGDEEYGVYVQSMYGMMTGTPGVEMVVPDLRVMMRPSDARNLALSLLEAAAGAETDAWLVEMFGKRMGASHGEVAVLIAERREWRAAPEPGPETGREP